MSVTSSDVHSLWTLVWVKFYKPVKIQSSIISLKCETMFLWFTRKKSIPDKIIGCQPILLFSFVKTNVTKFISEINVYKYNLYCINMLWRRNVSFFFIICDLIFVLISISTYMEHSTIHVYVALLGTDLQMVAKGMKNYAIWQYGLTRKK